MRRMAAWRVRKNCGSRGRVMSCPCRFHPAGPPASLILRRAWPNEGNAPLPRWSSPDLQSVDWKVFAAFFAKTRNLIANIFAQLPDRLERVLDQSASPDDDPGLSTHPDSRLHFAFG